MEKAEKQQGASSTINKVDTISYTFTENRLSRPDSHDFQRKVVFHIDGAVAITERYVTKSTRHAVKGTSKTRKARLSAESTRELFASLYALEDPQPGQVIYVPFLDATANVRLKSSEVKKAKEMHRPWSEQDNAFIETLFKVLDELDSDLEED